VFNNPLSFTDPTGYQTSNSVDLAPKGMDTAPQLPECMPGDPGCNVDLTDHRSAFDQAAQNRGNELSQWWQNERNRFQDSMVGVGGFWGGLGYVGAGVVDEMFVQDVLDGVENLQEGDFKGATINVGVIVLKPLKAANLAGDAIKNAKKIEKALEAKGGTYVLKDVEGKVVRTGRTNDLVRREGEHARDPNLKDFKFEEKHRTDVRSEQRGLEQMLHDEHNPLLNKINPISPKNPRLEEYMNAASNFLGI
jgi:hypothetical protein